MGQSVVAIVVGEGVGEGGGEGGGEGSGCALRRLVSLHAGLRRGSRRVVPLDTVSTSCRVVPRRAASCRVAHGLRRRPPHPRRFGQGGRGVRRQSGARRRGGKGRRARHLPRPARSQFEFLQHLVATEGLPWDKVEAFHLDEYVGLPITHGASFRGYLQERLFSKVSMKAVNLLDPAELGARDGAPRRADRPRVHRHRRERPPRVQRPAVRLRRRKARQDRRPPRLVPPAAGGRGLVRLGRRGAGAGGDADDAGDHARRAPLRRLPRRAQGRRRARGDRGPLTADCPASALRNHAHVVLWLDAPAASKLSKATIEGAEAKPE